MVEIYVVGGFVLYLIALIGLGVYGARATETVADYLLSGRRMNTFTAALSEQASLWSGWLTVGFPSLIYTSGMSAVWWMVWQMPLGIVTWGILAKRISRYSRILQSLTLPDFFAVRHQDSYHLLRVVSTIVIGVFMVIYVAGQLLAGASAITGGFDTTFQVGFLITVTIVIFYTLLGGFIAVSLTDVLQALLMSIFAILVPIFALVVLGGPSDFMTQLNNTASAAELSFFGGMGTLEFLMFSSIIVIALGGLGQPHGIARYMGMEQPSKAGFAMIIAVVFMLIALIGVPIIGFAGMIMLPGLDDPVFILFFILYI